MLPFAESEEDVFFFLLCSFGYINVRIQLGSNICNFDTLPFFSERSYCASICGHRGKIQRCFASALRVWFLPVYPLPLPVSPRSGRSVAQKRNTCAFSSPPAPSLPLWFLFSRTTRPAFFMALFIDGNTRPFKARAKRYGRCFSKSARPALKNFAGSFIRGPGREGEKKRRATGYKLKPRPPASRREGSGEEGTRPREKYPSVRSSDIYVATNSSTTPVAVVSFALKFV